jgi:hypothetical protein
MVDLKSIKINFFYLITNKYLIFLNKIQLV